MTITFHDELQQITDQVQAALRDPALHPHFAPAELVTAMMAYPRAGGKGLRPAMLMWSSRALNGDETAAVRAALAVELYHIYSLVHDDVIDRDRVRRGRPSVHALMEGVGKTHFDLSDSEAEHYGLSMAILAGDALHSWSILLLSALPRCGVDPAVALRLIRRLQGLVGPAIVEGEARDIQLPFLPVDEVSEQEILHVILTKTSALFAFCGWAGGLLARGVQEEDEDVRALAAFAERAGIAFQLQDDVLGIVGDSATLGKPVGSDLREGKRTLIVALGWARASEEQRHLMASVLGHPRATVEEIACVTRVLQELGAVDDTREMARRYLDEALHYLDHLADSHPKQLLRELAVNLVQRQR
jgi:geranylgeranyl diphosphate synthase type I